MSTCLRRAEVYEDAEGGVHLAVLDADGHLIWLRSHLDLTDEPHNKDMEILRAVMENPDYSPDGCWDDDAGAETAEDFLAELRCCWHGVCQIAEITISARDSWDDSVHIGIDLFPLNMGRAGLEALGLVQTD